MTVICILSPRYLFYLFLYYTNNYLQVDYNDHHHHHHHTASLLSPTFFSYADIQPLSAVPQEKKAKKWKYKAKNQVSAE